jgi:3-oxoacyl-[acyl-carrier-protein] synthase-3
MALIKTFGSTIKGIVSVVPKSTEDNLDLPTISIEDKESLIKHTGIRFRKIAPNFDVDIKDYFEIGIETLLSKLNWEKASIDILICVTQTTTTSIPSVSCRLHGDMKLDNKTMCYDINSGCSGFVYGLQTIQSIMQGFNQENVRALLCCGDLSSQLIEENDNTTKPIFSDGISIIGIESTDDKSEITGYFNLETAGQGQSAIFTSKGADDKKYMRLNGIDIYNYSVKYVPKNIIDLLEFASKELNFPDYYIFHQANKLINESIRKKLGLDELVVPSSLYEFGNTASASIPLTLNTIWEDQSKKSGWILISGFGVGFSMASGFIKFEPDLCMQPIEIEL